MTQLIQKFQRFMIGRYGHDDFSNFLFWSGFVLNILNLFYHQMMLSILVLLLWGYMIYRFVSKNYVKRSIENQKYQEIRAVIKRFYKVTKNNLTDHQYHYYLCPHCHQMVRIPRHKGKVSITCPTCHHTFTKHS